MNVAAILLFAVCVVVLESGTHAQGPAVSAHRGVGGIIRPGVRNRCWYMRCRPGWRCVQRRWRAYCVPIRRRRACLQPVNPGPCRGAIRRFFYNQFTGRCQRFIYGGCGGNLNNFYSWRQCRRRCMRRGWPIGPVNPINPLWPIMYSSDKQSSDS